MIVSLIFWSMWLFDKLPVVSGPLLFINVISWPMVFFFINFGLFSSVGIMASYLNL